MISVPCGHGWYSWRYDVCFADDIRFAYEGTDIISCLRSKYIMRRSRISYRISDISLKSLSFSDIISLKEWVFAWKFTVLKENGQDHFGCDSRSIIALLVWICLQRPRYQGLSTQIPKKQKTMIFLPVTPIWQETSNSFGQSFYVPLAVKHIRYKKLMRLRKRPNSIHYFCLLLPRFCSVWLPFRM